MLEFTVCVFYHIVTAAWIEKLYLPTLTLSTEADVHRRRVLDVEFPPEFNAAQF
jgi:hypothetical protein